MKISERQYSDFNQRVKAGADRVSIRVEVDKLVYLRDAFSEFDDIKYEVAAAEIPNLLAGGSAAAGPNATGAPVSTEVTTALVAGSPIQGVDVPDLIKTSPFGTRVHPLTGKSRLHNGQDFGYGQGTTIVATADGVVGSISYKDLRLISINHSNGFSSRYLHLGEIHVNQGEAVVQGQSIATVGGTDAYSTGSHLHFEIKKDGTAVDPMTYLRGEAHMGTVTTTHLSEGSGQISVDGSVLRKEPSATSQSLGTLSQGIDVVIRATVGEWYWISLPAGDVGYVQSSVIDAAPSIEETSTSTGQTTYGNPSYAEVVAEITSQANKVGLPVQLCLATAWTESEFTQFKNDGSTYKGEGENIGGQIVYIPIGIMQIYQDPTGTNFHPNADYNRLHNDWKYNIQYGLVVLIEKYYAVLGLGTETSYTDGVARASYSGYYRGSNYTAYRLSPTQEDTNFYNHYQNSPWNSGDAIEYGRVNGFNIPIKNDQGHTLDHAGYGNVYQYTQIVNGQYEVILGHDSYGYILEEYFLPITDKDVRGFTTNTLISEEFTDYIEGASPTGFINETGAGVNFTVQDSGGRNYLRAASSSPSPSSISFLIRNRFSGKCIISFKCALQADATIRIEVDGITQFNKGDFSTGIRSEVVSFSLTPTTGFHKVTITLNSTITGQSVMSIAKVEGFEYIFRDKLDNVFNKIEGTYKPTTDTYVFVKTDSTRIFTDQALTDPLTYRLRKGNVLKVVEYNSDYVRIEDVDQATDGYVRAVDVQLHPNYKSDKVVRFLTGRFEFGKTLSITDEVIGLDIERKWEMRASTCTVTLSNEDGHLSPLYKPQDFPEYGMAPSEFTDYDEDGKPLSVLSTNTPIRVYIGYGDNPERQFTGFIDGSDVDGENKVIKLRCTDVMKLMNEYTPYEQETFPDQEEDSIEWVMSAVIHEMALRAGMTEWKYIEEDILRPDIQIVEAEYVELRPDAGYGITFSEDGFTPKPTPLSSVNVEEGFLNAYKYPKGRVLEPGTYYADHVDILAKELNFWQRCDRFGTYKCSPVLWDGKAKVTFKDTQTIVTVNKTVDFSKAANHVIISGAGSVEHFFDDAIWKAMKGRKKTARAEVPWAETYAQKRIVANRLFRDMRMRATTINAVVEGCVWVDLLDTIFIEHRNTTTRDSYVIKGLSHSYSAGGGFLTRLDLFSLI